MRTSITLTELSPTAASGKLYFLADQSDTWMYIWHERGSQFTMRHNQLEKLLVSGISATDQQLIETVTQLLDQQIGQTHTKEGWGSTWDLRSMILRLLGNATCKIYLKSVIY